MMHNSQNEVLQKCVRRLEECVPYLPIGLRTFVFENIREAQAALSAHARNCDKFSKAEVLEMLDVCSFSKEDTIEWLYAEAKGEVEK